jgi:hypothetical protein
VEQVPFVRIIEAQPGIKANCIRLQFDMTRIGNLQEIDAVELLGRDGSRQWANRAEASSHWGQGRRTSFEHGDGILDLSKGEAPLAEGEPARLEKRNDPHRSAAEHADEVRGKGAPSDDPFSAPIGLKR